MEIRITEKNLFSVVLQLMSWWPVAINNVECARRPPPYSVTWVCTKIFSTSSPFPVTKFNWGVEQVPQVFVLLVWGEEKYRQTVKAVMPDFCFCNINFYCRMGFLLAFVSTALFPRTILSRGCNSSLIFDLEKRDLWFLQLCFNVSLCIVSGKDGIGWLRGQLISKSV